MASIELSACRPTRPSLLKTVARALSVQKERRALHQLDDAALQDVGLTRSEADAEAARPVWDVPAHWQR